LGLDNLALRWPSDDKKGKQPIRLGVPEIPPEIPSPKRNRDGISRAIKLVANKLRPDLDESELELVRETFLAIIDRDKFRAKKSMR
jgi:hypothetical protein